LTTGAEPLPERGSRARSLSIRLAIWYAMSSFALVVVASASLYWTTARILEYQEGEYLQQTLHILQVALQSGDLGEVKEEIEHEFPGGPGAQLFVRLFDASGRILTQTRGMSEVDLPARLFPVALPVAEQPRTGAGHRTGTGRSFDLRAIRYPLAGLAGPTCVAQVATDQTAHEALLAGYRRRMTLVLGLCLFGCTAVGIGIARRGMRPVARIGETLRRIRSTTLDERIPTRDLPKELLELATTSNEMLDGLERSFAQLSRFSADIAHELRTPLHNLMGELGVTMARPRALEEYRALVESCHEECVRLSRLIDSLLFLARAEGGDQQTRRQPVDLERELGAIAEFYEPLAAEAGVALHVSGEPGARAQLDRALFQSAVGNLIENAIAATARGGAVKVESATEADGVRIEISDDGCGIDPVHIPHLFDRLYRVDPARRGGSGLGLSIVKGIVALHGGSVALASEVGAGTRVTLRFPSAAGGVPLGPDATASVGVG
jgi:two-component system heavy metal sensor histidine kinase CusS